MTPETFVVIQAVSTVLSTFFFAGRLVADVKYRLGSRNLAYVASLILAGIAWIIGLEGGITNLWWGFRILRQPEDNGELIIWNIGLPPDKTDSYWRAAFIEGFITPLGLWAVKSSFLALYFVFLPQASKAFRYLLFGTVIYVILSFIGLMLVQFLMCPLAKQWTTSGLLNQGSNICVAAEIPQTVITHAVLNITSDILVILLPFLILRDLVNERGDKSGLAFIFFLATVTLLASAGRLVSQLNSWWTVKHGDIFEPSAIENTRLAQLLGSLELSVANIACSLPALRAVFLRFTRKKSSTWASSNALSSLGPRSASYNEGNERSWGG